MRVVCGFLFIFLGVFESLLIFVGLGKLFVGEGSEVERV